jgi:hypothetical protein
MAYYFNVLSHNSKPSSGAVVRFFKNCNLFCMYILSHLQYVIQFRNVYLTYNNGGTDDVCLPNHS